MLSVSLPLPLCFLLPLFHFDHCFVVSKVSKPTAAASMCPGCFASMDEFLRYLTREHQNSGYILNFLSCFNNGQSCLTDNVDLVDLFPKKYLYSVFFHQGIVLLHTVVVAQSLDVSRVSIRVFVCLPWRPC